MPFIDNHDLVRFASEPGATLEGNKLAMAFLATVRGMPQIYSGDEIYMQGVRDPDNRRDFPGGFDEGPNNVFHASSRTAVEAEMFDWTSSLMTLRNRTPALQTGAMQILYTSADAIVYTRTEGKQCVLIALHRGPEDITLHVPVTDTSLAGMTASTRLLGQGGVVLQTEEVAIELPANGALISALQ